MAKMRGFEEGRVVSYEMFFESCSRVSRQGFNGTRPNFIPESRRISAWRPLEVTFTGFLEVSFPWKIQHAARKNETERLH